MNQMKQKAIARYVLTIILLLTATVAYSAETATQLMNRVSNSFRNASTISATFSVKGAMGNTSGNFYYSHGKYAVITGGASAWYNGKDMWTYNPRTSETTIVTPSQQEVAENNPFSIISSMAGSFNAQYAKSQPAGKTVLVLIAKSSKNSIKKVVLTLDSKRMVPTALVITGKGGVTNVTVSKLVAGTKLSSSLFEYPKSKYPKAKIVDLR